VNSFTVYANITARFSATCQDGQKRRVCSVLAHRSQLARTTDPLEFIGVSAASPRLEHLVESAEEQIPAKSDQQLPHDSAAFMPAISGIRADDQTERNQMVIEVFWQGRHLVSPETFC
jgi:ERCC4-related helicase